MNSGICFNKKTKQATKIKLAETKGELSSGNTVWLDLQAPSEEELKALKDSFGFHELTIEDTRSHFHLPKLDEYEDYFFLIWHTLNDDPKTPKIENDQVNIYLGPNFLVMVHDNKLAPIEDIFDKCCQNRISANQGADWLLYMILDRFVDEYFPLIDRISTKIDTIEDKIFTETSNDEMRKLFVLKHKLMELKKIVAPQRDVMAQLGRFENKFISSDHIMYFRDIFDHLVRVLDMVDSSRDVVSGVMDIYLSSISNKMNRIMTRLTIVATIFLPLTLVTGIYGMNFRFMPELHWRYWYFVVWAFILVFGFGSYFYYRKQLKW